jgi:uncharacterized protein (DUF1330 family)
MMATPEEHFAAIAAEATTNSGPIHMINLIRYRDQAEYEPGQAPNGDALSGADAYQLYGSLASEHVASAGGEAVSMSASNRTVLGPDDEEWDLVMIVRWPNRSAFIEMMINADYHAIAHHRTAAVADSRLILTEPGD